MVQRFLLTSWLATTITGGDNSSKLTASELRLSSHPALQEHCLMGIKGTVRRATDGHIIHANVDTDVVVSEEPPFGSTRKPDELYQLIERFALGGCCWCSRLLAMPAGGRAPHTSLLSASTS